MKKMQENAVLTHQLSYTSDLYPPEYPFASVQTLVRPNKGNVDVLKLIGVLAMLIDHIGFGFLPQYPILRIIGRLAFPIFAYEVSEGYIRTHDLKQYERRLFLFALIAQIPYILFFKNFEGDTLFTLLLAVLIIDKFQHKQYFQWLLFVLLALVIPLDYGWIGVSLPILFYVGRNNLVFSSVAQAFAISLLAIMLNWPLELTAYAGVLLSLWFHKHKLTIRLNKYFFYGFYPIHLVFLIILRAITGL